MKYYYADSTNEVKGPITEPELLELLQNGTIDSGTNIVPEDSDDWQPLDRILSTALQTQPPMEGEIQVDVIPPPIPRPAVTSACPFCSEEILPTAKKCKHCGETLDVALRAAEEAKRNQPAQPMVFMNAGGAAAAIAPRPKEFPHILHLVISCLTCGAWLPIWIVLYLVRPKN